MKIETNNHKSFGMSCVVSESSMQWVRDARQKKEFLRVVAGVKSHLDHATEKTYTMLSPNTDVSGNIKSVSVNSYPESFVEMLEYIGDLFVTCTKISFSKRPTKPIGFDEFPFYDLSQQKLINSATNTANEIRLKYNTKEKG